MDHQLLSFSMSVKLMALKEREPGESLAKRDEEREVSKLSRTTVKVETREDEEQNIKLTEILELLVAAGYFRARIKGLSPFDKDDEFMQRKEKAIKTVTDIFAEDKKVALPPGLAAAGKAEPSDEDDLQAAEELRIKTLMTGMAAMATEELQAKCADLQAKCTEAKKTLSEVKSYGEKLDKELAALETIESQADSSVLQSLRALVAMNENLKSQEQEFKAHCREEMERLQQDIENLKAETVEDGEEQEPNKIIEQQYKTEKDKLQKIRLLLARRNREIAILQRKIDEVPSRAELTQYQKRFIELYSQGVYILRAMASSGSREQFLRQMEQIVEGIKQNRMKMEKKKQENKMRRDQLNDEYLELLEKQRLYFKTVKEFKEVSRWNLLKLYEQSGIGAKRVVEICVNKGWNPESL
ncbi:hypothetical protein llap_11003 [Limosa lapponica baueri]|uniref:Coiled-coil domain-containing protein 93 n=1 Tax=Limosa lapponica baueri TaxID=1758121 RepID=A0A2I0TXY7_LIMLA|nr:hypothetical protein llap_11003 [Limosa lapponica baueri]